MEYAEFLGAKLNSEVIVTHVRAMGWRARRKRCAEHGTFLGYCCVSKRPSVVLVCKPCKLYCSAHFHWIFSALKGHMERISWLLSLFDAKRAGEWISGNLGQWMLEATKIIRAKIPVTWVDFKICTLVYITRERSCRSTSAHVRTESLRYAILVRFSFCFISLTYRTRADRYRLCPSISCQLSISCGLTKSRTIGIGMGSGDRGWWRGS